MMIAANIILVIILICLVEVVIRLNHRICELEQDFEQIRRPLITLLKSHKIDFPWELDDES